MRPPHCLGHPLLHRHDPGNRHDLGGPLVHLVHHQVRRLPARRPVHQQIRYDLVHVLDHVRVPLGRPHHRDRPAHDPLLGEGGGRASSLDLAGGHRARLAAPFRCSA